MSNDSALKAASPPNPFTVLNVIDSSTEHGAAAASSTRNNSSNNVALQAVVVRAESAAAVAMIRRSPLVKAVIPDVKTVAQGIGGKHRH
jgi:hypothetical protein